MVFRIKTFSYHSSTKNIYTVQVYDWGEYSIVTKCGAIELMNDSEHSLLIGLDKDEQTNYCLTLSYDDKEFGLLFKLQPKAFFTLIDMYNNNKALFYKEIQTIEQGCELVKDINLLRQKQSGSSPPLDM